MAVGTGYRVRVSRVPGLRVRGDLLKSKSIISVRKGSDSLPLLQAPDRPPRAPARPGPWRLLGSKSKV